MEPVLQMFIRLVGELAKADLERQSLRHHLNVLWNGSPDWDTLITQEMIDSNPSFHAAGITKQMIYDVIFSEETARGTIEGNIASFIVMSQLV